MGVLLQMAWRLEDACSSDHGIPIPSKHVEPGTTENGSQGAIARCHHGAPQLMNTHLMFK